VVHPGLFWNFPLPGYPEIRVAPFARRGVRRIISKEQPDYIYVPTEGPLGFAARAACIKDGRKFFAAYHTHFPLYLPLYIKVPFIARALSSLALSVMRRFHNSAAATLVATESLRQELLRAGIKRPRVWHHGSDTQRITWGAVVPPMQKPVFLCFGRVAIEKNVEEFLRLELPGTKLVVGGGPDLARLRRLYEGKAVFAGFQEHLADWLKASDVCIFPSRTDTWGRTIVETLSFGIPVAAYDVLGPRDIITPGHDGYLGEDLREAALKCLDLSPEACKATAQKYSWKNSVDEFIELIKT